MTRGILPILARPSVARSFLEFVQTTGQERTPRDYAATTPYNRRRTRLPFLRLFTHSVSYHPWNPARPILVDEQVRWLCMPWLGRARKYTMWMSPPFTRGSTRTASTPSAIRRSLLSLSTNPWGRTLASPLSTFFHPLACFTLSCPFVAVTNSPFLCVVPVSRKSRPNPCCNARTTAITGMSIGCYAVLGAPLSWSKRWKRITSYTKYVKYGIFLKPNVGQVSLPIMSIPG